MLEQALKIIESLNKHKVKYVIIGGYAVILHGFLRATEDIDIVLSMTQENVTNFQNALSSIYDDSEIREISFQELQKYPVIRYGTPDNFYLDIISKIGELFSFDNIEILTKKINNTEVKFASAKSLFEMKKNTYREKDKIDVLFLKEKIKKND